MKKFSRLTALLLALTVLMTSMPLMSLASSITVDIDTWNSWVEEAQNAAANQTETVTTTVPVTGETSVVDRPVVEAALTAHEGVETSATQAVTLPIAGKLVLKAFDGASSYQWQVKAGSQWANIVGDRSASTTLTYAKIQNAISGGVAQVRCAMVVDGQDYVSATAQVTVDDTVTYTTVETESTLTVTAEVPVQRNYGLRSNGATTYDVKPNTYSVVVNYRFENDEIAADPYTASLAAGTSFSATVTFPTVQGYLPYLNEDQQNSIDLNFTAIDQDYTYNVVYKPTNVNYTVIHYQQNLNDDKYTEAERETKQGLTKSTVQEVAKAYDGFYALLYEKPDIAADGSTVVEVYYDRYYYLMNFDLDGGYGVEPIYARYGAPIGNVGTPTKAGYTFDGWTLNGEEKELPGTMPADNLTYKAVWKADDTAKVTVVFWGENADDEEYSYIKSAQVKVKPGTEFTYSEGGSLVCGQEEHTHDASCGYACNQEEHTTHIADCYQLICTKVLHTHDRKCCTLEEHEHSIRCLWGVICNKEEHTHGDGKCTCPQPEHTHTDYTGSCYTLTCTTPVHTHSDACGYNCGKVAHSHTSNCYMSSAGLDSNLWKFMRSDTVTVAADGSSVVNVYYDRTKFVLTFKYGNTTLGTINERWGANIIEEFTAMCDAARAKTSKYSGWEDSTTGNYVDYIGIMPQMNKTLTVNTANSTSTSTMTYYYEDLNGDYNELFKIQFAGNYNVTKDEYYEIKGFSIDKDRSTKIGSNCNGAKFYYTRNSYTLTFNDGYSDVKSESVKYQAELDTYASYVPAVPSAYEPGSVTFDGWYLNPECSGNEYQLNKHTMPADNVLLYAKWVPVTHTVEFYLDQDALDAGTKLSTHPDITVPHGTKADPTPANPTHGSYTFVGWFYMDNGVEKAFDFANMPVNKDLKVYGKWSSNVLKEYTIYYKIQGTDTEIAAPTTGSGLAGITKTFDAKGGIDLYAGYQEGYFPVTKSHSMTLDINATKENDTNVYTFWYVQRQAVPYTVYYVTDDPDANQSLGTKVIDGKTYTVLVNAKTYDQNRKAVVTETFVPVSGYLPDAYQKRLVVSAEEGAVNEIIFYYTKDSTHAYYKITHYTENLAKDAQGNTTWTEYASSQAVGDIDTTYTADPMTIPGFTYDSTVPGTVVSGKLTANGLELKLYYTRNSYPYQVRYLEQGTGKQLHDPKDGMGKYGEVVSESAIGIANYTAVDPTSQTLSIKIEESQTEAKLNIITFYYKEKEVTIHYQVVGPDGCGTVTPTSETVKVLSGTAQGSTASATSNVYRFVGWYDNAACSGDPISTNAEYVPTKADGAAWTAATYYAKFEYNLTTLTITKSGMQDIDAGQSFLFKVTGYGLPEDGLLIAIKGNGSETISRLTVGQTYTVTEVESWSWRYSANKQEITLAASGNEVTIQNDRKKQYWLDGDCYKENVFGTQVEGN